MPAQKAFNEGYSVENGVGKSKPDMDIHYEWIKDDATLTRIQSWAGYNVIQIVQVEDYGDQKFHRVVATIVGNKDNDMCIFTGKSVEKYDAPKSCWPVGGTIK
jgi:hypothetical protein